MGMPADTMVQYSNLWQCVAAQHFGSRHGSLSVQLYSLARSNYMNIHQVSLEFDWTFYVERGTAGEKRRECIESSARKDGHH